MGSCFCVRLYRFLCLLTSQIIQLLLLVAYRGFPDSWIQSAWFASQQTFVLLLLADSKWMNDSAGKCYLQLQLRCSVKECKPPTQLVFNVWWIHYFWDRPSLCVLSDLHNILLTYSMVQSPSWEANWFAAGQEIPRIFYGTWKFITALTSVRHLSLSWASPIQSTYPHPTSWISILILSTYQRLGLPSGLFPSGFPTKTLYTFRSTTTRFNRKRSSGWRCETYGWTDGRLCPPHCAYFVTF